MQLSKKQIIISAIGLGFGLVLLILIFTNLQLGGGGGRSIQLTVWGFDDKKVFNNLIRTYQVDHPNVKITYKQVAREGYDQFLLEALALGEGPDIFPVSNRSLLGERPKLQPAGVDQISLSSLNVYFPDVIAQDFVSANRIFALPLYLDTLVLYYNKDLFNQQGIVFPPATWEDFQKQVSLLRRLSESGGILRAGAAIGGSGRTISRAADILNMLMLQNGVGMVRRGAAGITEADFDLGRGGAGLEAFSFYVQFANPVSNYYTWNEAQSEAVQGFADGSVAMYFGYKSDEAVIKKLNPFLNLGVAPAPQVGGDFSVAYPIYEGLGVSRRSRATREAWDFVVFAATNRAAQKNYYQSIQRPPALRGLIAELINDDTWGIFARQALIAKSWPQINGDEVSNIFSNAIFDAVTGRNSIEKAIREAEGSVSSLIRSKL